MCRVQSLWLVGVLTVSVLGCGKLKDDPNPPADQVTPEAVAALVRGNNEFACTLDNRLAKEARPTDNVLFSPYSISAALAMTSAGARGKTAEEMASVLRFVRDQDRFHPAFAEPTLRLLRPANGSKHELTVANAIWPDGRLTLLPPFERVMTSHYATGMRRLNDY